jgi:tetratricopeptide (TPR) repeat protein
MRSSSSSCSFVAAVVVVAALLVATPAGGAPAEDARKAYGAATAAFGLGRYEEAAEQYENAFGIHPDPALLYNAAQSYRLAGNNRRALELYRNYIRLYPDEGNAADARNQMAPLKKAIENDRAPSSNVHTVAAPPAPPPVAASAPAASAAPPPQAIPSAAPPRTVSPPLVDADAGLATSPRAESNGDPSLTRRPWFWIAVGAVLLGGTAAVLVATRGEKFPDATLGTADGN